MNTFQNSVVVLAAGRGARLNSNDIPKVMMHIGGEPILAHTLKNLALAGINKEKICLVIGFKGELIRNFFDSLYLYVEQKELLGTAHATYMGITALPKEIENVLVLGGDDGAFYKPETLKQFIEEHNSSEAVVSLLTAEIDDPSHFGRIIAMPDGSLRIIEKEYVTDDQALIKEVSTGTFCFNREWFQNVFPSIPKLKKLGEYGLPTMFAFAHEQGKKIHRMKLKDSSEWFGINTVGELQEADRRKKCSSNI